MSPRVQMDAREFARWQQMVRETNDTAKVGMRIAVTAALVTSVNVVLMLITIGRAMGKF